MRIPTALLLALIPAIASGQDNESVPRPGITQPRLLHKVDPTYSKEAERDHVQGSEVFSIVVDTNGKARDIQVLSPLAWGLDQKGAEAILKWEFAPGMKDGMPVNVRAQVEVNFRFLTPTYGPREEEQRASWAVAIASLQTPDSKPAALNAIENLAYDNFPPAMSLLGQWKIEGINVAKDVPGGLDLTRKAADKFDADALFALAKFSLDGQIVPVNPPEGIKLMVRASFSGNRQAQTYLGMNYETGDGPVPMDASRASYYFKLCAARGDATCQFHLGKLLLPTTGGLNNRDTLVAIAWLDLAREGSVNETEMLALSLREKLSPAQLKQLEALKKVLRSH